LEAVSAARAKDIAAADALNKVAHWVETSFRVAEPKLQEERLQLCTTVGRHDAVAGCELRMLLAMEALQGCYFGERRPDIVLLPEETAVGLYCAKAVHDTLAWAAFAIQCARAGGIGYESPRLLHMLDEAAGILDGWRLEVADAVGLLSVAQEMKKNLEKDVGRWERRRTEWE
jgi:hypothetical protein